MSEPISISDPRIAEFLALWHENGREHFARCYPHLYATGAYDSPAYAKTAKDRGRKYIALDDGTSGRFLLEKATGEVWTIKAYGRPNRRVSTLGGLIREYREANERNRLCSAAAR